MPIWPAKKGQDEDPVKIESPAGPEAAGGDRGDSLEELTGRLGQLGRLLDQANEQVLAYLVRRESQAAAAGADDRPFAAASRGSADEGAGMLAERIDALAAKLAPLREKLDQVDSKLASPADKATGGGRGDSPSPALAEICDGIHQQFAALAEGIRQLHGRLDAGLKNIAELLRPAEPEHPAAGPATSGDWQRIIFGPELAGHAGLDFQRQQLLNGLVEGDPGACALIGQLLVFRSATSEKMPPLVKEIGEAYYRWQPKTRPGANPMEQVLVEWLTETMQDAGIGNAIELVHPGERFDSTRHTASTRGVEITEVFGWIVLRDNGKVYTKAGVAVK